MLSFPFPRGSQCLGEERVVSNLFYNLSLNTEHCFLILVRSIMVNLSVAMMEAPSPEALLFMDHYTRRKP